MLDCWYVFDGLIFLVMWCSYTGLLFYSSNSSCNEDYTVYFYIKSYSLVVSFYFFISNEHNTIYRCMTLQTTSANPPTFCVRIILSLVLKLGDPALLHANPTTPLRSFFSLLSYKLSPLFSSCFFCFLFTEPYFFMLKRT